MQTNMKGLIMAPALASIETADRIADIRGRIHDGRCVSLTDFARGKAWREKLAENGVLELQDRSGRIAWIVSEDDMARMVDYVAELEDRMERESIAAMLKAREGRENWMGGPELAKAATQSLESRYDALVDSIER